MSKNDKSNITVACEQMAVVEKAMREVVESFSKLEVLKASDSYLFGLVRSVQHQILYASNMLADADKANRPLPKTKILDPNLQKE